MAKYGARYLRFAPFASSNPEPSNAYPNYGTPVTVSKLVKVSDSPSIQEAKHYADDEMDEYVAEADSADIDVEVSDVSNSLANSILGASLDSTSGDVSYGDDTAPYGGLGFVCCKIVNNVKQYVGIYYPKVKAAMQGEDFETKGESINFANGKLKFKASKCNAGKWKVVSAAKTTADAAKTWVDTMLGVSSGGGTT